MKKALFSLLLIAGMTTTVYSQDKNRVICDETTVTDLKTSFKIETSNDSLFKRIAKQFGGKMTKYTVSQKKDRHGLYWQYSINFKQEDKAEIVNAVSKY